jgi:hypothetical protein
MTQFRLSKNWTDRIRGQLDAYKVQIDGKRETIRTQSSDPPIASLQPFPLSG